MDVDEHHARVAAGRDGIPGRIGPLENARHERFAQELAKGETADEAYRLAGFSSNRGNATRLKANERVQMRVEELLAGAAEKAEITTARVLSELGKIGFSDIRKLFNESGSLKNLVDLDDDAAACLASVEVTQRKVRGGDDDELETVSKVRMWDKRAALVDIGKHLGMFTEKIEHTGKDGGPIEVSDTDMARLIAFHLTATTQD